MSLPEGTLSGHYEPIGNVADADSVFIQELGSDPNLQSNQDIVDYVFKDERLVSLPMFVSHSLVKAVRERAAKEEKEVNVVYVTEGPSAAGVHENTGTFGELTQFLDYNATLEEDARYKKPAIVTSAYNAMNDVRQLRKIAEDRQVEMDAIVPPNLPRSFDWHSKQPWTKHWAFWALTAHMRHHILTRKGH